MNLEHARAVADAVLYEGYLLYPYRASAAKNQVRWQFGVLGPPGAAERGVGEERSMSMQCLLTGQGEVVVHLRFLQLQTRSAESYDGRGYVPVDELTVDGTTWLSWDEAIEHEVVLSPYLLGAPVTVPVEIAGGEDVEQLTAADAAVAGRIVRRRRPLTAQVAMSTSTVEGYTRLTIGVENVGAAGGDKDEAIGTSLIGAHLLVEAHGTSFVSLLDPPDDARGSAARCVQHRCWPVLTGEPGEVDLVLGSPIILYDHPEIAAESAGTLFDATEIDELLTLRVMTMTDEEKAEARATDPRAREIIDRCDQMTPETLQQMHGVLRNPHAEEASVMPEPQGPGASDVRDVDPPWFGSDDVPWWDPAADAAVQPGLDAVTIDGISVSRGSLVRVHPNRRADAQDLFFADQVARVTAVISDVDGGVHVALVLVDDPAADIHDWYGRYLYFAPDEVAPLCPDEEREVLAAQHQATQREESRP